MENFHPRERWTGKAFLAASAFSTPCQNENQTFQTALQEGNTPRYQFLFPFLLAVLISSLTRNDPAVQHHPSENTTAFWLQQNEIFFHEQSCSQTLEVIPSRQNNSDNWPLLPPVKFPIHLMLIDQLSLKLCCF